MRGHDLLIIRINGEPVAVSEATAQDLEELAEHLQQVFGAVLDCVGGMVVDTSHVAPPGRSTAITSWA